MYFQWLQFGTIDVYQTGEQAVLKTKSDGTPGINFKTYLFINMFFVSAVKQLLMNYFIKLQ